MNILEILMLAWGAGVSCIVVGLCVYATVEDL